MRFDECAPSYEAHAHIQKKVAAWSADWLDDRASRLTALELGAGTGFFTKHLAQRGFASLRATDVSERMMAIGKQALPQIEWRVMDAWRPSSPRVDRLYSCSLLQWAPCPATTLRRWRSLLAPRGRLLATFFVHGTLQELFPQESCLCALQWRSNKQWLSVFADAGWTVLRTSSWRHKQHFASPVAALRSLHGTGAVGGGKTSPGELRRLLASYRAEHATARGEVPLTWSALRVEAQPARANESSSSLSRS